MTETGAGETWEHRWLLPAELRDRLRADPDQAPATDPRRLRRSGRDWLVDSLLFAWAVGIWLLFAANLPAYVPGWMRAADPPIGALGCLAIWFRRRHPVLLAVVLIVPGAWTSTSFGPLTVAILNLGLRAPWRTGAAVLALHALTALPYTLVYAVPNEGGWATFAFYPAYYLSFFSWGAWMRLRRQTVLRLSDEARAEARRERAEHARRLADARRAEREAIAREMHDVLAHRVSLLSVHAGALAYRTGKDAPATALSSGEISDSAQLIRDTAHQALEELRDVLTVLRGTDAVGESPQPGLADIADLVADARNAGQRVTLVAAYDAAAAEDPAAGPRGQARRTVYRVVQEGLTNARKHAPGREVTVTVTGGPGEGLTVTVANELPAGAPGGASAIPGAGAGLAGLEERAALDGGTLTHRVSGTSFELTAELPWGRP
ncbi:sensor histidine kinase [Streptomyces radicis]|uniref:histidine kinase n=1 Tax=Streptomyces radicis TaxID=1750517 RepID=A0A3A9WPN9_9ACTN|nr:histidine kinase [Streptomyces radicis]RKN09726.1 histidine kinase [Streptomyces radicis]RKN23364.1 histidine kinase [Streptomyces radicis]